MSVLPQLVTDKLKDYIFFRRWKKWKDHNQMMIKEFRQKFCFIDNNFIECHQDESVLFCRRDPTDFGEIPIVDLQDDVNYQALRDNYIFNFTNGDYNRCKCL